MKVKKFTGVTLNQAVSQLKNEFGRDAVILHTKRIRRGGILGLFGRIQFEVIGAIDPNVQKEEAPVEIHRAKEKKPSSSGIFTTLPKKESPQQVKVNVEQNSWPETVQDLFQLLVNRDIDRDTAKKLIKCVLQAVPKEKWDDRAQVHKQLFHVVTNEIRTIEPWELVSGQKVVVLVGPTGVGKTTTIAKLAANYGLIANKRVGLITIDTYRMGAVDQLKTYSDIIGVPLTVAYDYAQLKEAVSKMNDRDLILIDTAGRSHQNKTQMTELEALLDDLNAETHLVLSACTKEKDLRSIIKAYSDMQLDRLIITKLDETTGYGIFLQAPTLAKVPIAFMTTGQSVPEDIEVADVLKMTSLVLGDTNERSS